MLGISLLAEVFLLARPACRGYAVRIWQIIPGYDNNITVVHESMSSQALRWRLILVIVSYALRWYRYEASEQTILFTSVASADDQRLRANLLAGHIQSQVL